MIYKILISERTNGIRKAGEMVTDITDNGKAKGAFRYRGEYLADDTGYSIDPVSIPLRADVSSVGHPGVFGVFEDSLPDDWGRRILIRKNRIPRHHQNIPHLLIALGGSGLGALSYSADNTETTSHEVSLLQLGPLVYAAEMFERGEIVDPDINALLGACSSPGGARPKALVTDNDESKQYIAKFPSIKDEVDAVRIEMATMAIAAASGLSVPMTKLVECGHKPVLLVERFDITAGGRRHMISFQTLLKAQGFYQHRYQDLMGIVRKYGSDPLLDSEKLYRQMVFNAVIGNTDDHLKNFWMTYDPSQGWRLSPSFDLNPDIGQRGEHVLFFDSSPSYPGREKLASIGRNMGIKNVHEILEQVFDAISTWEQVFALYGVPVSDTARFKEINKRLIDFKLVPCTIN